MASSGWIDGMEAACFALRATLASPTLRLN
jgi:hypothetical protein